MLYLPRPGSVNQKGVVVVPDKFHLFLMAFHDLPTGGHLGTEKMFTVMAKRCYWRSMRTDVAAYVKGCLRCAIARTRKPPRTALALFDELVPDPFAIVHVDHVVGLPRTPRGNEAILVIVGR